MIHSRHSTTSTTTTTRLHTCNCSFTDMHWFRLILEVLTSYTYNLLSEKNSLTSLHLCNKPLRSEGIDIICKAIRKKPNRLNTLHISNCAITITGIRSLVKLLQSNKILQLSISLRSFLSPEASIILKMLESNSTHLMQLNLCCVKLTVKVYFYWEML